MIQNKTMLMPYLEHDERKYKTKREKERERERERETYDK